MGGDHKCPVCQATFTRPQHVQRHMRSHTGDRPYKCQHCGDQFARSDLLSRHVNKCHANEKPPTTTAPNQRRKGSAAACRATTSKQACDQCVQSSLPCDGANPCSKCVQRKCRCTYVKFHRQTAPVGPGHQIRHDPGDVLAVGGLAGAFGLDPLTGVPRYQDDFYLNPAPGSTTLTNTMLPSMSLDQQMYGQQASAAAAQQFSFPPLYPTGAAGASLDFDPAGPGQSGMDYIARYRAQADLLRRAGVSVPPPAGLYADTNPQRYSLSTAAWPQHSASQPDLQAYAHAAGDLGARSHHFENGSTSGLAGGDSRHSLYSSTSSQGSRHPQHDNSASVSPVPPPLAYSNGQYGQQQHGRPVSQQSAHPVSVASLLNNMTHHRDRRHSITTNHSGDYDSAYDYESTSSHGREGSVPSDHEYSHRSGSHHSQASSVDGHGERGEGEGGFSSAFGMMSLDDPNVLAGLSNDAPPFFSSEMNLPQHGGENEPTPSANSNGNLKTPSTRETETRELRDFWKQYMRTPGSGGGSGWTPIFGGDSNGILGRPSPPKRGLSRVASLPSVKTPTGLGDVNRTLLQPLVVPDGQGQGEQTRTQLHFADREDLKSYEAAVLARKGLTELNLVPKKNRNQQQQQQQGQQGPGLRLPPVGVVTGISGNGATSSLAGALHENSSRPGTAGSDGQDSRPSMKRLASQTLEPEY
ncbi:hypothetical protein NEOLEDRAFT_1243965, partial [Neolentinus lepideus HHB14362 ss-1]